MIQILAPHDTIRTGQIGAFCPYWTLRDGAVHVADTAQEIIDALPLSPRVIDLVAVMELLQFNYMPGTRTLVQDVHKMPWRAELSGRGELRRFPPIPHGNRQVAAAEVARQLFELLQKELTEATKGARRIFLLLSGGYDSRVIASVLKSLESDLKSPIECVTWSVPNSRDLVYATEVSKLFGWEHHVVDYTPQLVWQNLRTAAVWGGAECTGIHLHGMQWFERCSHEDLVIGGTLGDMIGRAIYRGSHITRVALARIRNMHDLFRYTDYLPLRAAIRDDRATAWQAAPEMTQLTCVELDMQENFVRRLLCYSLDYLRTFCRLHQAFSSDEVVSLMWSLDPRCRTDDVYAHLLRSVDPRLPSIPNPKLGRALDGTPVKDQSLCKSHHAWDRWPREDHIEQLRSIYFSEGLKRLRLFHPPAVKRLWASFLNRQGPNLRAAEDVIKLCTIELARQRFDLHPPQRSCLSNDPTERVFRGALAPWMETSAIRRGVRWWRRQRSRGASGPSPAE